MTNPDLLDFELYKLTYKDIEEHETKRKNN